MNKTFLILKHEFLSTIKRKGFIILTFALPVLALLGIGVFYITSGLTKPSGEIMKIGYVDEIQSFDQFVSQGNVMFVNFDTPENATQALIEKDIIKYIVIPHDFISTGVIKYYTLEREVAPSIALQNAVKNFIISNLLAGRVSEDVVTRIEASPAFITVTLAPNGGVASKQGGLADLIVPGIFCFLLAFSLTFSSSYVLQSFGEEKESRLMEILLSSVSTRQLITGKVLGIGAAGLTQVAVWVISIPFLLSLASSSIGGSIGLIISMIKIPVDFWVFGIIYFILGYLLFAVLSASVAAVTSSVREAQGLAALFTLFSIAPFWFYSLVMFFPNNPVCIFFSIFPFSAPVLILLRMSMIGVPVWQLIASMVVLIFSIIGGLFIAAKLLKIYILMYGKRPTLSEIVRNLKR